VNVGWHGPAKVDRITLRIECRVAKRLRAVGLALSSLQTSIIPPRVEGRFTWQSGIGEARLIV
jgi:hypothetical protein